MAFLAGIAPVLAAVGSVVSGVGTFVAAHNNAVVQQYNAEVADRNAQAARVDAAAKQQEQDFKNRALLGSQFAGQAASNIDVGSGSPVVTRMNARELARLDALNIHQAGEVNATNFETKAQGFRLQAGADESAGAFGLLSGFLNAGTAITNAKATASRNYYPPVPTPRPTILS